MQFIVSCCCSFSVPSRVVKSCIEHCKWFSDREAKQRKQKINRHETRQFYLLLTILDAHTRRPRRRRRRWRQEEAKVRSIVCECNSWMEPNSNEGMRKWKSTSERDGASGREDHTCMPSPFCLYCNNTKRQGENCCCCFGSWITQLENFGVDFTRHAFKSHLISLSFEL